MEEILTGADPKTGQLEFLYKIYDEDLLMMLGNPLRVRILRALNGRGVMSVADLAKATGENVGLVRSQLNALSRYFMIDRVKKYPAAYRINDRILKVPYVAEILKSGSGEERLERRGRKAGGN